MTDLKEGEDGIQPLSRWQELVGASRPTDEGRALTLPPPG
jgi:hypothetical protein